MQTEKLGDLLPGGLVPDAWRDTAITGISVDSRTVLDGNCFLAYPGHAQDGRRFIAEALNKGAAVVLAEADGLQWDGVGPVIAVANLKQHLGEIASRFFANPSASLKLIAVSGTNGKTTVTSLIAQAAEHCGHCGGVIGTLGNGPIGQQKPTGNTTPDIITINRALADMRVHGVDVVAMEASSHGLVQGRLDGLTIHAGLITNLSRDHLDYHGSMEAYRDAKALLAKHATLQHLVLNQDDLAVVSMASLAPATARISTFSMREDCVDATVKAISIEYRHNGLTMQVAYGQTSAEIQSQLVGEFNAANLLAALAILLTLGVELEKACAALSLCSAVGGRVEMVNPVAAAGEPSMVVDFAHTPDALEKVLNALRRHCAGKLWCVFGCGGDRDAGKRPLMGATVARHADNMVITSDNPRSEKPARIIADIVKGLPSATAFEVIEDRTAAIEYAVVNAAETDLILLAGKGHEDYQEVQGVKYPYSDILVARHALAKRKQMQQGQNL